MLLTDGSLWKMTTLPPLSPVARRSPSWLNSTHDIISAEILNENDYLLLFWTIYPLISYIR